MQDELTPKQYRAITQLAAGYSTSEVAKENDVNIKTIEGWRRNQNFKKLFREALSQCFDASVAELVLHSRQAAKELSNIAFDPDTPSRVRISAITAMLTFASRAKDAHLESRLEILEQQLENANIDTQAETIRNCFSEHTEERE